MKWKIISAVALIFVVVGVKLLLLNGDSYLDRAAAESGTQSPMVEVDKDDAELEAAIQQARKSVDVFLARFAYPKEGDTNFSVKMKLTYQTESEHVWLTDITYEQGVFIGKIGNDPEVVTHVRYGETVQVSKEDIFDWMWLSNGKIHGGYTLRALLKYMPKAEADRLRKQFHLK